MTAILTPDHDADGLTTTYTFPSARPRPRLAVVPAVAVTVPPKPRPTLVVIEGGRSAQGRRERNSRVVRHAAAAAVMVLVAVLLWGIVHLGAPPAARSLGDAPRVTSTRYTVRPGDSLWGIATALRPAGDVRDVVDRLASVNGGATVFAGERLRIPADLLH